MPRVGALEQSQGAIKSHPIPYPLPCLCQTAKRNGFLRDNSKNGGKVAGSGEGSKRKNNKKRSALPNRAERVPPSPSPEHLDDAIICPDLNEKSISIVILMTTSGLPTPFSQQSVWPKPLSTSQRGPWKGFPIGEEGVWDNGGCSEAGTEEEMKHILDSGHEQNLKTSKNKRCGNVKKCEYLKRIHSIFRT